MSLFPDIRGIHQCLICSNSFGNHKALGPKGSQNCIKRVPLSANFGEVSVYDVINHLDYIECGSSTWSRLQFTITDMQGTVVDFNDLPISFNIFLTIKE